MNDARKSLPGAPKNMKRKTKLDIPRDWKAVGKHISKIQTKLWAERKKTGWKRRTEQRG